MFVVKELELSFRTLWRQPKLLLFVFGALLIPEIFMYPTMSIYAFLDAINFVPLKGGLESWFSLVVLNPIGSFAEYLWRTLSWIWALVFGTDGRICCQSGFLIFFGCIVITIFIIDILCSLFQVALAVLCEDALKHKSVNIGRSVCFALSKISMIVGVASLLSVTRVILWYALLFAFRMSLHEVQVAIRVILGTSLIMIFSSYVIAFEKTTVLKVFARSFKLLLQTFWYTTGVIILFSLIYYGLVLFIEWSEALLQLQTFLGAYYALASRVLAIVIAPLFTLFALVLTRIYQHACGARGR